MIDSLTGFPLREFLNRINFTYPYSLAFVDLDGLKTINDAFGHQYGDILIKEFANHLKNFFNKDTIVRYGGDEFVVIRNEPEIKTDCEKFLHYLIDKKINIKNKIVNIRCSIGIYSTKTKNESIKNALDKADQALYTAKGKGKFIVSEFGEEILKKEPPTASAKYRYSFSGSITITSTPTIRERNISNFTAYDFPAPDFAKMTELAFSKENRSNKIKELL